MKTVETRLHNKDKKGSLKIGKKGKELKHISLPIEEEKEKGEISLKEIIEDQRYQTLLYNKIEKLKELRSTRPFPEKGRKYRRDVIDTIEEKYQMNHTFFLDNIGGIWMKVSKLEARVREFIKTVCEEVLEEWLIKYQEKKKKGKKNIK